jgi:hypothetical protein
MTPDLFPLLPEMLAVAGAPIATILAVRRVDQRQRDKQRVTAYLRFPRNLSDSQILLVVPSLISSLAPPRAGFLGRASIATEVLRTADGIAHRIRVPKQESDYVFAQLRAAMPGLAIEVVETFQPELWAMAKELRCRLGPADLQTSDVAAVSRTILAAMTELRRGEEMGLQLVISGGLSERATEHSIDRRLGIGRKLTKERRPPGARCCPRDAAAWKHRCKPQATTGAPFAPGESPWLSLSPWRTPSAALFADDVRNRAAKGSGDADHSTSGVPSTKGHSCPPGLASSQPLDTWPHSWW